MADVGLSEIGRSALRKASWRLLPLIGLGYGAAYMDRVNISFAALQMNHDLGFTASIYGFGGGLFFLSYAAGEAPSNLALMRFGARRWIARIMFTWGLIATGMLFVRTPMQFYVMRFLLGAAEAGFFPGVVYYLMQWFPSGERGRAISRFYVSLPLSGVVMGALAGALLGLRGTWGLAGWQWLFLVEGGPALILALAILFALPDSPAKAKWLTNDEKDWIAGRLAAERASLGRQGDPGGWRILADARLWLLGAANIMILGAAYAFNLSAPTILTEATKLDATGVGWLTAAASLAGAVAMAAAGWHSDKRRERYGHTLACLVILALAFTALGLSRSVFVVVAGYAAYQVAGSALQTVFWLIPSDALAGRSAALGVAAIGSIGMLGSFVGPWAWGVARDATGGWQAGLLSVAAAYVVATCLVALLRMRAASAASQAVLEAAAE
jgi:ACS family tartrate transporter-like MFS transporter